LAVVLGSGFAGATKGIKISARLACSDIPGFPIAEVKGHEGQVLIGVVGRNPVLLLSGRVHYYEGYEMDRVTFGIRTLAEYGIDSVLLTNAAGAINRTFRPGNFMIIEDHINLMGVNPLRAAVSRDRDLFVDMANAYDATMRNTLNRAARHVGISLRRGVYLAVSGPSYETPAEIRAFRALGADAVGMSTVPEAIVARQCGLRVAGISCITNMAAGASKTGQAISHQEVINISKSLEEKSSRFLRHFIELHEG
jgi:purine-nucleoside phosphorylase